jgi:hypothetical protein
VVGDHKLTWEVNRHQWFITLAQAWRLTGDASYLVCAEQLLSHWLAGNPPKVGINWCSSLELAFRVQSWIQGLRIAGADAPLSSALRTALVASVATHATHIEHNLSTWFSPNTHLTGEALALLSVGCAWPSLPDAARWRTLGWRILSEQLPRQVRADGVYFEQSSWYQAYTVDFYVLAVMWARFERVPIPTGVLNGVQSAALALRAITRPDGTIPLLGDDDGGCALPLRRARFGDVSDTLWRAGMMLGDARILPPRGAPGPSALLWLEGHTAYDAAAAARRDASVSTCALRDGGWVALAEANGDGGGHLLVLDAGPHGTAPHGHSHADALSFDLTVQGVPVIVDAGTGAYVGEARTRYRSTAVHNTVTVDGLDSSEQLSAFKWRTAAHGSLLAFGTARAAQWAAATHTGYTRLPDPVLHRRTILRVGGLHWIILDRIEANAGHEVAMTFQCAAGAVVVADGSQHSISVAGVAVELALDPHLAATVELREISPMYACEMPADAIVGRAAISGTSTFCSAIGALRESGRLRVDTGEDRGLWRITHSRGVDLVAVPDGRAIELRQASFNGAMLVLSTVDGSERAIAAGAGELRAGDLHTTLGTDDICVAVRRTDGSWALER